MGCLNRVEYMKNYFANAQVKKIVKNALIQFKNCNRTNCTNASSMHDRNVQFNTSRVIWAEFFFHLWLSCCLIMNFATSALKFNTHITCAIYFTTLKRLFVCTLQIHLIDTVNLESYMRMIYFIFFLYFLSSIFTLIALYFLRDSL